MKILKAILNFFVNLFSSPNNTAENAITNKQILNLLFEVLTLMKSGKDLESVDKVKKGLTPFINFCQKRSIGGTTASYQFEPNNFSLYSKLETELNRFINNEEYEFKLVKTLSRGAGKTILGYYCEKSQIYIQIRKTEGAGLLTHFNEYYPGVGLERTLDNLDQLENHVNNITSVEQTVGVVGEVEFIETTSSSERSKDIIFDMNLVFSEMDTLSQLKPRVEWNKYVQTLLSDVQALREQTILVNDEETTAQQETNTEDTAITANTEEQETIVVEFKPETYVKEEDSIEEKEEQKEELSTVDDKENTSEDTSTSDKDK